ncbi:hypothetical protein KKA23_00205 [Patescibacteria group bacterium]|nr:hypothetical protein [Patescibacteria group bacterium]
MSSLIIVSPRICPSCNSISGMSRGSDYDCPFCRKSFCSHCYKTDPQGSGNYVFCPHCNKKLYFPKEDT